MLGFRISKNKFSKEINIYFRNLFILSFFRKCTCDNNYGDSFGIGNSDSECDQACPGEYGTVCGSIKSSNLRNSIYTYDSSNN